MGYLGYAGVDLIRLRARLADRLVPLAQAVPDPPLPLDADAMSALEMARATASERLRETIRTEHLFDALIARDDGPIAELLRIGGGSLRSLREVCARSL